MQTAKNAMPAKNAHAFKHGQTVEAKHLAQRVGRANSRRSAGPPAVNGFRQHQRLTMAETTAGAAIGVTIVFTTMRRRRPRRTFGKSLLLHIWGNPGGNSVLTLQTRVKLENSKRGE